MAIEEKNTKITQKSDQMVADTGEKSPETLNQATGAPNEDETSDAPDSDDISDILSLLNIMDVEIGGKGEIADVPEQLRGSIKYLVDKLTFVRDLFADPLYKSIIDDMADQKEDGQTPSIEVAIARNIPMGRLQELAENEDYENVQNELAGSLEAKKSVEEEDAMYAANFEASQKAGQEYASEMGYDEARTNQLFDKVMELFKIMGDGILTKAEFADVDKMLNYENDINSLKEQLTAQDAKEVLPDKASVESIRKEPAAPKPNINAPGLGSMNAYENVATDITQIGQRKRGMR